jgi:hypothetical protein
MKTTATHVQHNDALTKRTFWAALAFYVLIAFEFFYIRLPHTFIRCIVLVWNFSIVIRPSAG